MGYRNRTHSWNFKPYFLFAFLANYRAAASGNTLSLTLKKQDLKNPNWKTRWDEEAVFIRPIIWICEKWGQFTYFMSAFQLWSSDKKMKK